MFKVTAPVNASVSQLKHFIWKKGKNGVLSGADAKDLVLGKVSSKWVAVSTLLTSYSYIEEPKSTEPLDTLPQCIPSQEDWSSSWRTHGLQG